MSDSDDARPRPPNLYNLQSNVEHPPGCPSDQELLKLPTEQRSWWQDIKNGLRQAHRELLNAYEHDVRTLAESNEKALAQERAELAQKQIELDRAKQGYTERVGEAVESAANEAKTLMGRVVDERVRALTVQLRSGVERTEALMQQLLEMKSNWEKETAEKKERLARLYR